MEYREQNIAAWSARRVSMRRHPALLWAFALLLAAGFASLGHWQMQRRAEKSLMLDAAAAAMAERRPQPMSALADPARRQAYDWMTVRGHFADAPAVLLDNQRRGAQVGVRVYRLFAIADRPDSAPDTAAAAAAQVAPGAILVELGWLPLPADRRMPRIPRPQGEFALQGLALPPPGSGLAMAPPAAGEGGHLLTTTLDPQALAALLGAPALPPRVLRPAPEQSFGDDTLPYVRDFEILPNTLPPERHLGYAVQWFALSATVLIVALVLTLRMRRRRARPSETSL